jgi:PAS domain S-box-containing protein
MCNNPNWEPIEFVEDNEAKGIAIDVLNEAVKDLGIELVSVQTKSWAQSQQFLKEKKCDILAAAAKNKRREKYALFTKSYINYKLAIITKNDKPFVRGIESILDKTMSRKKASGVITLLKEKYPGINIKETSGYEESLKMVSNGDVYYTIATLPVASHYISKFGLYNLHIAGYLDLSFDLSVAVRDDKVILRDIFQSALERLPKKSITKVENEWSNVKINEQSFMDYSLAFEILLVVLIVIVLLFIRQQQLKKYQNELQKQNLKFEKMLTSAMEAIVLIKESKIIDVNDAAVTMYGIKDKSFFIGKNMFDFITEDSKQTVQEKVKLEFSGKYEISFIKADGTVSPALIQSTKFEDNTRIISIIDLTEIKRKENLLSQSIKMAQMGEMIGNIAHQWRQPLSVITTAATGIKLKKDYNMLNEKELDELLSSITKNANYLSDTIEVFRNFIREKVELKKVVLQDRIDSALAIINTRLENKYIKLIKEVDRSKPLEVEFVVGELSQVIINIINNSIDVLDEVKKGDKWIKVSLSSNDKLAIITIEDNGGGIKEEILHKVFDPYFTTKHKSQGTGIGLYMSYDIIVNHMGGKLYATNTQQGAKFFIELNLK